MIHMIHWYHSAQLDELYNFGFSRRRPQRRFSSWKKLLSLHQGPQNFLKAPLRGGVSRAARGALRTPLRANKLGLLTRARAGAEGENFWLPSHPTEAALSLAWSFGNHFRKHSESWCPLDAPKLGGDLGFLTKMGFLEIGPDHRC